MDNLAYIMKKFVMCNYNQISDLLILYDLFILCIQYMGKKCLKNVKQVKSF